MKTKLTILALTVLTSITVKAQTTLVQDLQSLQLKPESVVDLAQQRRVYFAAERNAMLGFSMGPAPTQEGIPGTHNVPDPGHLIKDAYSTATIIVRALEKAQTLDSGSQIRHYEAVARRVVQASGDAATEQAVRMVMNRAVDTANNVLAIMGRNTDYVRDILALFYEENFKLAAAYANNPINLVYQGHDRVIDNYERVSIAEFGRKYATLMWNFSAGLTSDSSKAVFLMKMMGYLGWDLNIDLQRTSFRELIADIYLMQTEDPAYLAVLEKLKFKLEPSQPQLAGLRSSVRVIYDRVIPTFQHVGVRMGTIK